MIEALVLVRHGETVHNVAGTVQGWQDSALSDKGRDQVQRLAQRLLAHRVDAIFSSPLQRARATADAIAAATGLEVHELEDLREMNYGGWEGMSFLDVRRDWLDHYHRWAADPDFPCPDGESHNDVLRRMGAAFEAIKTAPARRPVVVSHGTAIRIGATALLNVPIAVSRSLAQDNASINLFVWRGDRFVMKVWNDTSHCAEG